MSGESLPELVSKWRTWQRGKSLSERTITERTAVVVTRAAAIQRLDPFALATLSDDA